MTPKIADVDLVGYDYFAEQLGVQVRTIRAYAAGTEASRLDNFPKPATPPKHRQPLFLKSAADEFIAQRRAGSITGKGRIKPATLSKRQRAARTEAQRIIGREINLDDRRAVREAVYTDLELPVINTSKNEGLPSVDTATITKLHKQTGHPFLAQLLTYRGINIDQK